MPVAPHGNHHRPGGHAGREPKVPVGAAVVGGGHRDLYRPGGPVDTEPKVLAGAAAAGGGYYRQRREQCRVRAGLVGAVPDGAAGIEGAEGLDDEHTGVGAVKVK